MPSRLAACFTGTQQTGSHLPFLAVYKYGDMPEYKQTLFSTNQPNRPIQFNRTCQLNPNHGFSKMSPTPPSPSANETPPAQSNGHAHGDVTAINPPPTAFATPSYDGNGDVMDPDRHHVTDDLGYQYPWSPDHDANSTHLTQGMPINKSR